MKAQPQRDTERGDGKVLWNFALNNQEFCVDFSQENLDGLNLVFWSNQIKTFQFLLRREWEVPRVGGTIPKLFRNGNWFLLLWPQEELQVLAQKDLLLNRYWRWWHGHGI